MRVAILLGGSGYIAKYLLKRFIELEAFDNYFVLDIRSLDGFEKEQEIGLLKWQFGDVREVIDLNMEDIDLNNSWIFNFAAVHREPGHTYKEYFDTNIPGAKNTVELASRLGIKNVFFTSSIAPYGKSLEQRTENSALYPETAYGISKGMAELIHQEWLAQNKERRLIIVRPSVIYGPNDPGNIYRMINALKKGFFVLPDGGKIIKGYGYIYGLVDSILFTMNKTESKIIYNYAENPTVPLYEMVSVIKEEFNYSKPTISLPVNIISLIAFFVYPLLRLLGKQTNIHPVRVRKAGFPTNVKPQYLLDNEFDFKYDLKTSLQHWKSVAPEDFK